MEVLDASDVLKQNSGETVNGLRRYTWAKPSKILRIFRIKFKSLEDIFDEINKYKMIEKYLPPDSYSKSCEFVADYIRPGKRDFILCGLQDFIDGKVLILWDLFQKNYLKNLVVSMLDEGRNPLRMTLEQLIHRVQKKTDRFIGGLKKMILEEHYVPDLAGIGNLILTAFGDIKLVDINNISKVSFGPDISLDDKGYPVCDKSIEAISIMEQKLLDRSIDRTETIYQFFLDPQRMKAVKDLESKFHHVMESTTSS